MKGSRMKKILLRIFSVCLIIALFLPTFVSCRENEGNDIIDTETGTESTIFEAEVNIGQYQVVRSEKAGESATAAAMKLRNAIKAASGIGIGIIDDWTKPGGNNDFSDMYEVLIGNTNRPESDVALERLGAAGQGYIILVTGKKIAVAASSDALLDIAVEYFIHNYLSAVTDNGIIRMSPEFINTNFNVYNIIHNGKSEFTIIRPEKSDSYTIELTTSLGNKIRDLTGAMIKLGTDWNKPGTDTSDAYEILIGSTTRSETQKFLNTLDADEYGIAFIGHKIVVAGWTVTTTAEALDKLTALLSSSATANGSGTKDIVLTVSDPLIYRHDGWITDFPEFTGGTLSGAYDTENNALEYYYTGATADSYRQYKSEVEAAGYTELCDNQIGANIFASYQKGDILLHTYYVDYLKAVRIITEPKKDLPKFTDCGYIKNNGPSLTAAAFTYKPDGSNRGQCEIIRLYDGSFFIIDSGCEDQGTDLFNELVKLNGGPDNIVIAAWFFTHGHSDHYGGFVSFSKNYAKKVKLEAVYINAVSYAANEGTKYQINWDFAGKYIYNYIAMFGRDVELIKPHTGWKFYVGGAEIEVLYTQEDIFPMYAEWYNDFSTVIRVNLGGQSIIFLGDIMDSISSRTICSLYSASVLRSDIMQVAHHGTGGSATLYGMISPAVVIFPCTQSQYEACIVSNGPSRELMKITSVRKIIVSDNGSTTITLPYTPT